MQAYPAYTWDMIDEELSLYQIHKLLELWKDKELTPQIIDNKIVATILKGLVSGKE